MLTYSSVFRTILILLLSLSAIMGLALCSNRPADSAQASTRVTTLSADEWSMLTSINAFRKLHKLSALTMDARLTRTATWMSADMASNNRFSHTDSLGRDPFRRLSAFNYPGDSWRGENLAAGYAGVNATFLQWVNSPGHRANMLNPHFRAIGIAHSYRAGATYRDYWATEFGSAIVNRALRY